MSEFKVPYTKILEVVKHPNADKLDICRVFDFYVVTQHNKYKVNDYVIYIPVDSIISEEMEKLLFSADSKIKLTKRRIRQIRIRQFPSQGMLVDVETVSSLLGMDRVRRLGSYEQDEDLSEALGVTKYEPPAPDYQNQSGPQKRNKPLENIYFHKYGGIDNARWYPNLFEEGELVSVTEKIHGSHVRFGYAPFVANTLWKKIKKFLGLTPTHEWVYGSNNVQLQERKGYKGFYGEDVYGKVLEACNAKDKCKPGEIFHGEVYGDGIQKNYKYGCKNGEHKLILFDLRIQTETSSEYVDSSVFRAVCKERGFDAVPELYNGPFNKENVLALKMGDSVLCPEQKVREGIVVKPVKETECIIGRKMLKFISEAYLDDSSNSDFH